MTNAKDGFAETSPAPSKGVWEKPEIVEFKSVTVARGLSFNAGDGFANLS